MSIRSPRARTMANRGFRLQRKPYVRQRETSIEVNSGDLAGMADNCISVIDFTKMCCWHAYV